MAAEDDGLLIDASVPSAARMYDCLLGGKDNYAADREAVAEAAGVSPLVRDAARYNREFLGRAVTWAAGRGVRQFLDLGCGYPMAPNTHDSAGEDARTVYVDCDPVVLLHARALLAGPGITAVQADLRDAEAILGRCEGAGWDLAEPVCAVFGLVLQYFGADEAREAVARYSSRLAPGSAVIISTWACDDPELAGRLTATHPSPLFVHSGLEVASFLGGLELVEPGVARAKAWRPGWQYERVRDADVHIWAAVGVKGSA